MPWSLSIPIASKGTLRIEAEIGEDDRKALVEVGGAAGQPSVERGRIGVGGGVTDFRAVKFLQFA